MLYRDHIPFLDRELERLEKGPFDLSARSFLEVLGRAGTPEADAACRVFAATLEWPPVPDRVRLELCFRLACARAWCAEIADDSDSETEDGRAFLEEVLITYWRDDGRVHWLHENYCLRPHERGQP